MSELDGGELDELLRALASPHRRRLLSLLWDGERSAGELAEALGLAPASTSEHLKVLRKVGLVDVRVVGTFRLYRAQSAAVGRLRTLLDHAFPEETR